MMSSMTDNPNVEDCDDNGVAGGDLNLRHISFADLRNALVSLNETIQGRVKSFPSTYASIKPADRELLANVDSTIKLLEKFKWQILSFQERVEEGQLHHKRLSDLSTKRDSGISSTRGSRRISQLECIGDEQDSTVSDSFDSAEQNGQTPDPSSSKEQTIIESETDDHVKTADITSRSQQNHDRHKIQLYQLTEVKGANGKSCYNFVPFESPAAFNISVCQGTGFSPDRKHETEKEMPHQIIHGLDSAAECRNWQEHNQSPNQLVHLRLAVSECNLRSSQTIQAEKSKTVFEQQSIIRDSDAVQTQSSYLQGKFRSPVFSLGPQSTKDNCQQTAEVYDPSFTPHNPSLTSISQTGKSMNLLKTLSTKSLPSKLGKLTEDGDIQKTESTASLSLQDIADVYRLKIQLTDNTCGFYDLHLLKPVSSSETTEVKYVMGEELESNVNVKEESRSVIAADKHAVNVKEFNETIPVKDGGMNNLSKHSNEDNNDPSISTSASECDFLQHKLVRKTGMSSKGDNA